MECDKHKSGKEQKGQGFEELLPIEAEPEDSSLWIIGSVREESQYVSEVLDERSRGHKTPGCRGKQQQTPVWVAFQGGKKHEIQPSSCSKQLLCTPQLTKKACLRFLSRFCTKLLELPSNPLSSPSLFTNQ